MAQTFDLPNDLITWPRLSGSMPVVLPNGATVSGIHIMCPTCHNAVPDECTRVKEVCYPQDVFTFTAYGACTHCQRAIYSHFRVRAAGPSFQVESEDAHGNMRAIKPGGGLLARIKRFLIG